MVASSMDRSANPRLTSRQRRDLSAARKVMGEEAGVRAFAAGRANARWSAGARWSVGIFVAVFAGALVLLHVVLIPGALLGLIFYDMVRPRRGVAVTATGVVELKLGTMNGRPTSVLATTSHGVLVESHTGPVEGKREVRFGAERVALRDRDLRTLQVAIPVSVPPIEQRVRTTPPVPPPPATVREPEPTQLPRWREATFLWIVAHVGIGVALFVGIFAASNVVGAMFGRDTKQTADSATNYLWGIFFGPIAGWLLFVYWRGSFRTRMLLLGAFAGGALLLACIVNVAYSPAIAH